MILSQMFIREKVLVLTLLSCLIIKVNMFARSDTTM